MIPEPHDWISLFCKGDEAAYEFFFAEYYSLLGAFVLKYVKEREVAEDIVHDVILELYSRRLKFDSIDALKSYLYLSIKNKSLNCLRHGQARENYLKDYEWQRKEDFFSFNRFIPGLSVFSSIFYNFTPSLRRAPAFLDNKLIFRINEKSFIVFFLSGAGPGVFPVSTPLDGKFFRKH